jgi:hypothetical protein
VKLLNAQELRELPTIATSVDNKGRKIRLKFATEKEQHWLRWDGNVDIVYIGSGYKKGKVVLSYEPYDRTASNSLIKKFFNIHDD